MYLPFIGDNRARNGSWRAYRAWRMSSPVVGTRTSNSAGVSPAARAEHTTGKSGLMQEEREELARRRTENRLLAKERDIVNKAAASIQPVIS